MAAKTGSGFITIPAPPPKGRSSAVRCLSVVQLRRSWTLTDRSSFSQALAQDALGEEAVEHPREERQYVDAGHGAPPFRRRAGASAGGCRGGLPARPARLQALRTAARRARFMIE